MVRSLSFILTLFTLLSAQERVLLRIGEDGRQEAIPLAKGEHPKDVIQRLEQHRSSVRMQPVQSAGRIDTLKYFNTPSDLTTNFGWTHQDVAFQWYIPKAHGVVKEFWWLNYTHQGFTNKKSTIRAWYVDPRVEKFPSPPNTKYIGTYKDPTDGDGGVQPFKPASGNQWFYSNGSADSVTYSFDPMLSEAKWLNGGLQVILDTNVWQGIKLADWGDSMIVKLGEPFGFTLSNDTKKPDFGAGVDSRMEILSTPAAGAPYHSWKYYETGRTAPENAGWHLRGDYEWGMYVVIEYTGVPPPKIIMPAIGGSILAGKPREYCITIIDDNPNPYFDVMFFYSRSSGKRDSIPFVCSGGKCCVTIPASNPGDTTWWYVRSSDQNGNRTITPMRSYITFSKTKPFLFIYNNAGFSRGNAGLIYFGKNDPANYDYWSSPSDGTGELSDLMDMYQDIVIADGSFPARNVYTALKERISRATELKPLSVFFTSQDYGCYITANCADTTFGPGTMEYDYFGLSKIGPQDLPPTDREFRLIPQNDPVTDYLVKFAADSGSKLWYDPTFELGFAGYQDAVVPRDGAKVLFKDDGTKAMGIKFITPAVRTAYMGFDIGALQFRIDTNISAMIDKSYKWVPTDVGSVANEFFKVHKVSSAEQKEVSAPRQFVLEQNYPNPFNPSTVIRYSIPDRELVQLSVYNILGQKVADLVNGVQSPGDHTVEWNAAQAASGVYFYELRSGSFASVRKMVLMK